MKWEAIPGWLEQEDVDVFDSLDLPEDATILECGTYCGKSATALSELYPKADIYIREREREMEREREI